MARKADDTDTTDAAEAEAAPAPASTSSRSSRTPAGTRVTLAHHWTDPEGKPHTPGSAVTVAPEVARSLIAGGYARPA